MVKFVYILKNSKKAQPVDMKSGYKNNKKFNPKTPGKSGETAKHTSQYREEDKRDRDHREHTSKDDQEGACAARVMAAIRHEKDK